MSSYQIPIKHNNEFSTSFNNVDYDVSLSSKSNLILFNELVTKALKVLVIELEETIVPELFRYLPASIMLITTFRCLLNLIQSYLTMLDI